MLFSTRAVNLAGWISGSCESLRYGCMSYASKAPIPDEVKLEERLMKIKDPTSRYMEYLRLTSKPPSSSVLLDIPGRLPPGRRAN